MKRRRAARGRGGCGTQAKAANTCEHRDLQVIYRHWRAKRGWHPARHPCHPLNLLEIYTSGAVSNADFLRVIVIPAEIAGAAWV